MLFFRKQSTIFLFIETNVLKSAPKGAKGANLALERLCFDVQAMRRQRRVFQAIKASKAYAHEFFFFFFESKRLQKISIITILQTLLINEI